jgi:hypothetical protein
MQAFFSNCPLDMGQLAISLRSEKPIGKEIFHGLHGDENEEPVVTQKTLAEDEYAHPHALHQPCPCLHWRL